MLGGQFSSPSMREEAWQWLRDNYEAVLQRLPGSSQSATFEFPDGFCDSGHRKELDTFLTPKARELGMGELELARTLEHVDLCVAQKERHATDIRAGLGD